MVKKEDRDNDLPRGDAGSGSYEALKKAQEDKAAESNEKALSENPDLRSSMPSDAPGVDASAEGEEPPLENEITLSSARGESSGELKAGRKSGDVVASFQVPAGETFELHNLRVEMTVAVSDEKAALELRVRGQNYPNQPLNADADPTTVVTGNTVGIKTPAIPLPPKLFAGKKQGRPLVVDLIQVKDDALGEGTVIIDGGMQSDDSKKKEE